MTDYIISEETRDALLKIILFLQKHMFTEIEIKGEKITLSEIQSDLQGADPVLTDGEYDSKIEELLYIVKEMK